MVTCFVKGLTYAEEGPLHITPILARRLVELKVLKPMRKLGWFTLKNVDGEDAFWFTLRRAL